jgi:hypothetical protein
MRPNGANQRFVKSTSIQPGFFGNIFGNGRFRRDAVERMSRYPCFPDRIRESERPAFSEMVMARSNRPRRRRRHR